MSELKFASCRLRRDLDSAPMRFVLVDSHWTRQLPRYWDQFSYKFLAILLGVASAVNSARLLCMECLERQFRFSCCNTVRRLIAFLVSIALPLFEPRFVACGAHRVVPLYSCLRHPTERSMHHHQAHRGVWRSKHRSIRVNLLHCDVQDKTA